MATPVPPSAVFHLYHPLHANPAPAPDWSSVSLSALHAEIARRQNETDERPSCGSGASAHHYNTPLHVFALFLILILSTAACSFPVIVRRFPKLLVPNHALFVSRHFGTGVLIATAFVHLLPTAYTSLTDPCLPRFWTQTYPAMSGFIAMVSVMVVVGIEMFFAMKGAKHSHGGADMRGYGGEESAHERGGKRPGHARSDSFKPFRKTPLGGRMDGSDDEDVPLNERGGGLYVDEPAGSYSTLNKPLPEPPLPEPPRQSSDTSSDLDLDELDPSADSDTQPLNGSLSRKHLSPHPSNNTLRPTTHSRTVSFMTPPSSHSQTPASEKRLILQCLLLEAGILFHSIFIGMALSVSTGPAFIVLLIAISFHQTFEGLALGSRIAAISSFSTSSPKPWLMSFMYGVTTPVGQAIGLAVHGLYDPASQVGLLMVGCVNAVSSGLLLYAGLVQLLAEDFLSDASYAELKGRRRLQACAAVVGGSMLMAFVGAFA